MRSTECLHTILLTMALFMAVEETVQAYALHSSIAPGREHTPLKSQYLLKDQVKKYDQRPFILFLENKGQITDQYGKQRKDIDFRLQANGINAFIGSGMIHYQWNQFVSDHKQQEVKGFSSALEIKAYRMDVRLLDANTHVKPITEERQAYFENHYFRNEGRAGNVQAFKKIIYPNVYPHIDWVLYVNGDKLEYDFIVHPGGKVSDIKIAYEGCTSLKVNKDGSLTAQSPMGSITEKAPYSYLPDGKTVASSFVVQDNIISFNTAAYKGTLTIDPEIKWGTYYGGSDYDYGYTVFCDKAGHVYMTGQTSSATNIATSGTFQTTFSGGIDMMIVCFDSTGQRKWGTYCTAGAAMSGACDAAGNIYVIASTNIPGLATAGSYQNIISGSSDALIVKFDTTGQRIWATYYGGEKEEYPTAVTTDRDNNIYVTGYTQSTALIATSGAHQATLTGDYDAFLVKFDSSGQRKWGTYYGGSMRDQGLGVHCDDSMNVYISGYTLSATNIASPGSLQDTLGGNYDAFLAKFDSAGARKWATYYGNTNIEQGLSVTCDPFGNVILCGYVQKTIGPNSGLATPNSYQDTLGGAYDVFLAKFNSMGDRLWATYYGGNNVDYPHTVSCDVAGNIYVVGYTQSASGISTPGSHQDVFIGGWMDGFIAKFNTEGNKLLWGSYYGGSAPEEIYGVASDEAGNLYITGYTRSPDKIATTNGFQPVLTGGGASNDAFLVRFQDCPELTEPTAISGIDTLCPNTLEMYSIPPVPGATAYLWTLPDGWAGNSDTNSIQLLSGNSGGAISVRAANYCDTSEVQTFEAYVYAFTPAVITVNEHILSTSDSYATYQWFLNEAPIPNATERSYTVTENGDYTVAVTSTEGCTDTSDIYTVTNITGIRNVNPIAEQVNVYPNPSTDVVYIQSPVEVNIAFTDIEGRMIHTANNARSISIKDWTAGIYLLRITDSSGGLIKVIKIVKQDK